MTRIPANIQSTGNTTYFVPQTVLKVEELVKIYGKRRVVDGVSFHVNKGEVVGLLGPNGAGKTTSFRMTCGLIDANQGVVFLNNKDVTNWPLYRRAREGGMGYLPQNESVFRQLSVQDNLLGMMELLGFSSKVRHEKCDSLLEKLKLTHLRKNLARGLSGGERRRLEIARALVPDPKIILLDEPFAAIDPITVQSLQEIIRQLSHDGISILITDHGVTETLAITNRSYVIEAGKVLCSGTPDEVLANEQAQKAYFGNIATPQKTMPQPHGFFDLPRKTKPAAPQNIPLDPRIQELDKTYSHSHSEQSHDLHVVSSSHSLSASSRDLSANENGEEDFISSRRRPSVKVRAGQSTLGQVNADSFIHPNSPDSSERPPHSHFETAERLSRQRPVGSQTPDVVPRENNDAESLRLPKFVVPQGNLRRRVASDDPRRSQTHSSSSDLHHDNDSSKPTPRASLLGRLSGVFKKPKE
ncbi:MAG: LPS export ABC transporter ATP-binding protein [Planctomycetaceae bacterium]|jgi:lipopolysaccharide export system ATP-binding protein|nr:LPS export ABC transporter ATP-binding protein [Planctomycetaceae bacterium]